MRTTEPRLLLLGLIPLLVLSVATAGASDASAPDVDAGALDSGALDAERDGDAGDSYPTPADPAVTAWREKSRAIRELMAGRLDAATTSASLFEVSLTDQVAIRVDAERLRALLREADADAARREKTSARARGHAGDAGDAGVAPALWSARLDLDRARLAFYELPEARRAELVAAHDVPTKDVAPPPTPAEARAQQEVEQKKAALEAAQRARAEAERIVASEVTRLVDVGRAQARVDDALLLQKQTIAEQRELTIGWQQRALDARAHPGPVADRTYEELRGALRAAREALAKALDQLGGGASATPNAGADGLAELRVDVDTTAAKKERALVEAEAARLTLMERGLRRERAAQLFDEIDTLNGERLALLGYLSPEKRAAVTGLTSAGLDQATSEARQLTLILRYHGFVIGQWVRTLRDPRSALAGAAAGTVVQMGEWLLALIVFLWWRRRSPALLILWLRREEEADRRARNHGKSAVAYALGLLSQVHRPLEWLALLTLLRWLLPTSLQNLLEVRVVGTLMAWVFGASFVVDLVDAFAGAGARTTTTGDEANSSAVRLRSLRLVSRVVVSFGLILRISSMLVGRGTIYQWVSSVSWLASLPVLVVLVGWWRTIVFERTRAARKTAPIQRWVLAHSEGFGTSFAAAAVGGVYLFASGVARRARSWVGKFVITRRALAYLFRRRLDKREQESELAPIAQEAFATLSPEASSSAWIPSDLDEALERLSARIRARKGGVVAIVGERGMGKSTALGKLEREHDGARLVQISSADPDALRAALRIEGSGRIGATLDADADAIATSGARAILLDDAHRFVQPVMGGLVTFDALLAAAGRHATTTTWVFALDQVIWKFLERARGAKPLFDEVIRLEPWREEEIVRLLEARTAEASLTPSFESLLAPLPATADELDRQDALNQRSADYYRLVWDTATGNPGVALHLWRRSLGSDAEGRTMVRPSTPLDTSDLERLPDSSAFVLRAVLQLAPARAEQISHGTMIRLSDVADALRYAAARGYVEEHDGGYRISWTWFRAITLFLQRKHLLVTR